MSRATWFARIFTGKNGATPHIPPTAEDKVQENLPPLNTNDFQYKLLPKFQLSTPAKILVDSIETHNLVDPDVGFNFDSYSEAIADIIKSSKPQFTVGIYGEWGTGKTTLMNMVRNKLNREIVSWDDIANDNNANRQLREYLKKGFGLDWIDSQEIRKADDGKTLEIYDETQPQNSVTLTRNSENGKAALKINGEPVYEFILDDNGEDGNLRLRENNTLTIWFNAWRYESEEHLALIPLMKMIAYAMGKHPIYQHIRPIILKALFIIGKDVLRHYATQYIMTEKGIDEFEKNIVNKLERSAEFEKDVLYFDGMKKIQDEMGNILRTYKDTRIVIFIDDLDRCDPQKALQVFESIKVFLDMEGFVFVLGLSKSALLRLIEIKLKEMGLDEKKSEEYLRKIIQVDIQIKKWSTSAIETLINNHLKQLNKVIGSKIIGGEKKNNMELIKGIVELNPRQAKRLMNNLIIATAAYSSLNITAFLVVEYVSKKWHVLYENISDVSFLKFCKTYLQKSQTEREQYIADLNKELEEKAKQGIKPNDLERKKIAFTEEFLNHELWSFLKNYEPDILSGISADESVPTEKEIYSAKDLETVKSARESVEEVNPIKEKQLASKRPTKAALLELLKEGKVEEFNDIRAKYNISPNLSNVDLVGASLSNANLTGANLTGANLSDSKLLGANLSNANLLNTKLLDANLSNADLSYCSFIRANLFGAKLFKSRLYSANLTGANLSNADLSYADLHSSIIIHLTYQSNLKCIDANFEDAIIDDENLSILLRKGGATNVPTAVQNKKDLKVKLEERALDEKIGYEILSHSSLSE